MRAFVLVLDSVGIGGAPDAAAYGDEGADTVRHIAEACARGEANDARRSGPLALPNLVRLGLGEACTLAGGPDDRVPTEGDLVTVDDAARLLERVYRRFDELRLTLTPEWLNTMLTLRAIGRTFTMPRWAILRHIVNHSSYHRGQVASKLKRFGIEQSITDFFWWMIEQVPQQA